MKRNHYHVDSGDRSTLEGRCNELLLAHLLSKNRRVDKDSKHNQEVLTELRWNEKDIPIDTIRDTNQ